MSNSHTYTPVHWPCAPVALCPSLVFRPPASPVCACWVVRVDFHTLFGSVSCSAGKWYGGGGRSSWLWLCGRRSRRHTCATPPAEHKMEGAEREPCPYRIVDDVGGAFLMGTHPASGYGLCWAMRCGAPHPVLISCHGWRCVLCRCHRWLHLAHGKGSTKLPEGRAHSWCHPGCPHACPGSWRCVGLSTSCCAGRGHVTPRCHLVPSSLQATLLFGAVCSRASIARSLLCERRRILGTQLCRVLPPAVCWLREVRVCVCVCVCVCVAAGSHPRGDGDD